MTGIEGPSSALTTTPSGWASEFSPASRTSGAISNSRPTCGLRSTSRRPESGPGGTRARPQEPERRAATSMPTELRWPSRRPARSSRRPTWATWPPTCTSASECSPTVVSTPTPPWRSPSCSWRPGPSRAPRPIPPRPRRISATDLRGARHGIRDHRGPDSVRIVRHRRVDLGLRGSRRVSGPR